MLSKAWKLVQRCSGSACGGRTELFVNLFWPELSEWLERFSRTFYSPTDKTDKTLPAGSHAVNVFMCILFKTKRSAVCYWSWLFISSSSSPRQHKSFLPLIRTGICTFRVISRWFCCIFFNTACSLLSHHQMQSLCFYLILTKSCTSGTHESHYNLTAGQSVLDIFPLARLLEKWEAFPNSDLKENHVPLYHQLCAISGLPLEWVQKQ